jgi:hypothetical protein
MNIPPINYRNERHRRKDIVRQVEQSRLARIARENDSKKNTFVTIKNMVVRLFSRSGIYRQSATQELVEEAHYGEEDRATSELQA